ncbi:unnamed protein product [Blepharisma stoltei]|uniref:Uncharacterized protein n=1 Tax=Blepharisma stoltei TaxID=1481888 RepID=A0AAU9K161_9CILI|nr:unnamed protein product [Blepharisma stoltei]
MVEGTTRTDISLQVGEVPTQPGVQAYIHLTTGDNLSAKAKETVAAEIGSAPQDFNAYVVINCSSAEGAEEVKGLLAKVWTGISSGSAEDDVSKALNALLVSDAPHFNPEIAVHGTKVVVRGVPSEAKQAEFSGIQEMVRGMAGHVFGHDQTIHLEFDIGHEIGAILLSENKIVDALNSLRLSFAFHGASTLASDLLGVAEGLNADTTILRALRVLTVYQSADLQLKFRSASQLPDSVKEKAQRVAAKANLAELKGQAPPQVVSFLGKLSEHTTGDLHVFVSAGRLTAEFKLHAPGLLRALSA